MSRRHVENTCLSPTVVCDCHHLRETPTCVPDSLPIDLLLMLKKKCVACALICEGGSGFDKLTLTFVGGWFWVRRLCGCLSRALEMLDAMVVTISVLCLFFFY